MIKTAKCKVLEVQGNKYSIISTRCHYQGRKLDERILEIVSVIIEIIAFPCLAYKQTIQVILPRWYFVIPFT